MLEAILWNIGVVFCSPEDISCNQTWTQATLVTGSPLTLWLSHTYACHRGAHILVDTYRTEHWPPTLCLARSGVVMCLSQRVPPASSSVFTGFLLQDVCQHLPCEYVCVKVFSNKCSISWQPRSSHGPIYGAHAWPVLSLCFLLCQMLGLGWGHLFS